MNPNLVEDYTESKRTIEFTSNNEVSISTASYVRIRHKSNSRSPINLREVSTGKSYELPFNNWSELLDGSLGIYCTKDSKENSFAIELTEYNPNFQNVVNSPKQVKNVLGSCFINKKFDATIRRAKGFNHYKTCDTVGFTNPLAIVIPSWWIDEASTHREINYAGTISLFLEYPIGVYTPFTFNGSNTGSLPATGELVTDSLNSVFIPKGATIGLWYDITTPAGMAFRDRQWNGNLGSAMETSTSTLSELIPGQSINNTTAMYSFQFLAGIALTDCVSAAHIGNSIGAGAEDTADITLSIGNVCRPLRALGVADCNFSNGGDQLSLLRLNSNQRIAALKYFGNVIIDPQRNDINSLKTESQVKACLINVLLKLPENIGVFLCTMGPDTTSSDSFATPEGQTLTVNSPKLIAHSKFIRTVPLSVDGYFDIELAECIIDTDGITPTGLWKVPGMTNGGVHPTNGNKLPIIYNTFASPDLKPPGYTRKKLTLVEQEIFNLAWTTAGEKTINNYPNVHIDSWFYLGDGTVQLSAYSTTASEGDTVRYTTITPWLITDLNLPGKSLIGPYPKLNLLTGAVNILIHTNKFSGPYPELFALSELVQYSAGGASPTGSSGPIASVKGLSKLVTYIDDHNGHTGAIPSYASNIALVTLKINNNAFTSVESGFALPISIKTIWFDSNSLTAAAVNAVLAAAVVAMNAGATAMTIRLQTGNAAPTGQGVTDVAALTAGGNTVTTT